MIGDAPEASTTEESTTEESTTEASTTEASTTEASTTEERKLIGKRQLKRRVPNNDVVQHGLELVLFRWGSSLWRAFDLPEI